MLFNIDFIPVRFFLNWRRPKNAGNFSISTVTIRNYLVLQDPTTPVTITTGILHIKAEI